MPKPDPSKFFQRPTKRSLSKARIVSKYFDAWCGVLHDTKRLAYRDLYSGRGQYIEGSVPSTPMQICNVLQSRPETAAKMALYFNEESKELAADLEQLVTGHPVYGHLKTKPIFTSHSWNDNQGALGGIRPTCPTLAFLDPFGYDGLSLNEIGNFIQPFGCDCIFLLNTGRLIGAIENPAAENPIEFLFGGQRLPGIRKAVGQLRGRAREEELVRQTRQALKSLGSSDPPPFRFESDVSGRTSYHLFLVSKAPKAGSIWKEVLAKEGTKVGRLVTLEQRNNPDQESLVFMDLLDELMDSLDNKFAGQTRHRLEINQTIAEASSNWTLSDVRKALLQMERDGRVFIERPDTGPYSTAGADLPTQCRVTFCTVDEEA